MFWFSAPAEKQIMKPSSFFFMALFLNAMLASAQNTSKENKPNDLDHGRINITGCLTKNSLKEFELVDQDAIDNLPYSAVVDLDQYVGKTVTLSGRRAATQHDTGREKPHSQVTRADVVSDQCEQ